MRTLLLSISGAPRIKSRFNQLAEVCHCNHLRLDLWPLRHGRPPAASRRSRPWPRVGELGGARRLLSATWLRNVVLGQLCVADTQLTQRDGWAVATATAEKAGSKVWLCLWPFKIRPTRRKQQASIFWDFFFVFLIRSFFLFISGSMVPLAGADCQELHV